MSQEAVTINYESFQNDENALSDLTQAVQKLTVASEEQFNEIKEETWFKRLFDKLTFSKKNEKRMAQQIGTLAQAQSILLEILLRMSNQEQQVAQLVRDNIDSIRKLQENDCYLLERIKRLENLYVLGIKKSYDINELTENEKCILSGCLYYLAEQYEHPSLEQQAYANNVLSYIQAEAQLENLINSINELKEHTRTEILCCCMEYIYLYENVASIPEELNDFIDEFNLGNKTIRMIWEQITKTIKLRGIDGLINKYTSNTFDLDFSEEFYIECDEDFLSETTSDDIDLDNADKKIWETYDNTPEKELVKIVFNECIEKGIENKKIFVNKEIHLSSIVTCRGSLAFINCKIIYGSENSSGQIILEQGLEGDALEFINCDITCEKISLHPFINAKENVGIALQHCTLNNLSNFIKADNSSYISITNTKFSNPKVDCIKGYIAGDGSFSLDNCFLKLSDEENMEINRYDNSIFNISFRCSYGETRVNCLVNNCTIKQSSCTPNICIFSLDKATFKNCLFENVHTCIKWAINIEHCKFHDCKYICKSNRNAIITNSLFYNCGPGNNNYKGSSYYDNSMLSAGDLILNSCKFYKCTGPLINSNTYDSLSKHGTEIANCDFIDLALPKQKHPLWSNNGLIRISHSSDGKTAIIKNCAFNYISSNEGYLIETHICDKLKRLPLFVQNCTFNKCITLRNDKKLIQERDSYHTWLLEREIWETTTKISDCIGLNNTANSNTFSSPIPDELSNSLEQLWNDMHVGCDELIKNPQGGFLLTQIFNKFLNLGRL